MTVSAPSVATRPHLEALFDRIDRKRARLIFAIDATASRQSTWDTAARLQGEMFNAVATIGGLDVQLVYFRGWSECVASKWLNDAKSLASIMSRIMCAAGQTQIGRVLNHAQKEHREQKINALVLISDACEEIPETLYVSAGELGVPVFVFQEGNDPQISTIFATLAKLTGGAHVAFNTNSAVTLAELLKAVAAFATGGTKALANQNSDAARLLLIQIKK
jgi:hypothetical protein